MTNTGRPISENELHAYVDGRLDASRQAEVETMLAASPEVAARVRAYQRQNDILRATFDPVLTEPLPAGMHSKPSADRHWVRYGIAAAWAVLWAAGGWFLRDINDKSTQLAVTALPQQAVIAHAVYVPEVVHPVEVTAAQQAHLVKWLSKRLGGQVNTPDLRALGYELIGGRLLPSDDGAAAQFMYETTGGKRLTLYVRRNLSGNHDTAFRYTQSGDISVFYWIDKGFGYALSGELHRSRLLDVAHEVYDQLSIDNAKIGR